MSKRDKPSTLQLHEQAAIEALKQGMALIRRGTEVYGLREDGSSELIARAAHRRDVWKDVVRVLHHDPERATTAAEEALCKPDGSTCLKVFTDGASRGNPGPASTGWVLMNLRDEVLEQGGTFLGKRTNNYAEYMAVKEGLEHALRYGVQTVDMYMDSQLVVNQMNGIYRVKHPELLPIYDDIKQLSKQFQDVEYHHIRREYNKLADKQANIILDERE